MTLRSALIATSVFACLCANGQYEPDTTRPRQGVSDVFLMGGTQGERRAAIGLDDWRLLAPRSELLKRDLSGYEFGGMYRHGAGLGVSGAFTLSVMMPLNDRTRQKRSGSYIRGGCVFHQFNGRASPLVKETRTPYDTLSSSGSGTMVVLDSVVRSTYEMEHTFSRVGVEAAMIFLKAYPGRWTLYGGAGAGLQVAFDGRVRIEHRLERSTEPDVSGAASGARRDVRMEREDLRTRDAIMGTVFFPLGVTYRLGKRRPFWRAMNLGYELRPGLVFGGVPEVDPGLRGTFGFHFGLRVDLRE